MNEIVLIALKRPYTFVVLTILIAIADSRHRVHLRNVTLGENLGEVVQITSGLAPSDRLVNNPSAGLLEGARVRPVNPAASYFAASNAPEPPPGAANGFGRPGTP